MSLHFRCGRMRKVIALASLLPLLQVGACQPIDLQSALTVGVANFTILQATFAADTIFRNLFRA